MEIFMSNIPPHATSKELKIALESHVNAVGVLAYSVKIFGRPKNKASTNGILTLPTTEAGQKFLELFGDRMVGQPLNPITVLCRRIYCKPSQRAPDKHLVQSLVKDQKDILVRRSQPQPLISKQKKKLFEIDLIECGIWSTEAQSVPIFESYYSLKLMDGTLQFKAQAVQIDFSSIKSSLFGSLSPNLQIGKRISIMYPTMASSIIISDYQQVGDVIFTLGRAPKMYQKKPPKSSTPNDFDLFGQLLRDFGDDNEKFPWERISSLDHDHGRFVPFAFVYRLRLKEVLDVNLIEGLGGERGIPEVVPQRISLSSRRIQFEESFRELSAKVQKDFEFPIAFQLHALFANGSLPPYAIVRLLPHVSRLAREVGTAATATIMEAFLNEIPLADPLGELHVLSDESLLAILDSCAKADSREPSLVSSAIEISRLDAGMTYVYHVSITPAGCYLYGPKLEMLNRVLRKYPDHHEYFLRVIFCEEDGDQMMFEPRVSQRPIYDGQYRHYLSHNNHLVIAGRSFQFLGFSSSSLRSQSCWFMAPFAFNDEWLDPAKVISRLGDFSGITCPGRCAARIGQAFSDTVSSIDVPEHAQVEIADIKRGNRNFSDGIGTISKDMLGRIWAMSEKKYKLNSTVLQIRFAGAKGVVSLDTRLKGSKLCLRDSMIKFRGSTDRNIEICSRAKRLPMVLNRPLIKILEDLGVVGQTFTDLQHDAVKKLRDSTKSAAFAANFLRQQRIAPSPIRFPWMIEAFYNIGLNFRDDKFLERVLEIALLTALRDLKHKARIPVPNAVTLMGIVDETGVLDEGEIYCPYRSDKGKQGLVTGYVLITRSPAYHPGDVQMAMAVTDLNIPENSPLKALNNCVVFSQKGSRDLPSKLSGGDLDGDLYNIIYDPRFTLDRLYDPAEHPRVEPQDLGRPVQSEDIVDFFLDFMQNNILGLISTRHLIIADQKEEGVNHPDCLTLAQMASTAVDFPKTGIKVDKSKLPRCSPVRPDFLAPGPRMFVEKKSTLEDIEGNDDEDGGEDLGMNYYESKKILGTLYRAIDETKFLKELQAEVNHDQQGVSVIDGVWNYLERGIPDTCIWYNDDRLAEAKNIKDSYEKNILGMMRSYSDTPWKSMISEVEVFIGCIVGRERQTKRQRDASITMRDDFGRLAESIVDSIKGESREDTLAVGMGCLSLCRKDKETQGPQNGLQSFSWIVASVLLTEMDKMQKEINPGGKRWQHWAEVDPVGV